MTICYTETEESNIVTSLGSSLQYQSNYELAILNKHLINIKPSPLLIGTGFPDLSTLGTSQNSSINKPHVLKVLYNLQKRVNILSPEDESHKANMLRMKYQILLVYLSRAGVNQYEVRVNKIEELNHEELRRVCLCKLQKKRGLLKLWDTVKTGKIKHTQREDPKYAIRNPNEPNEIEERKSITKVYSKWSKKIKQKDKNIDKHLEHISGIVITIRKGVIKSTYILIAKQRKYPALQLFINKKKDDDYHKHEYKNRIDEWKEYGIPRMKLMRERMVEQSPGDTTYKGGLYIPAWVNNSLFPYQRTALQWLWKLHRENCGGIVGDEMGLGKTVQISSFLGVMIASRKISSVLIICPATLLRQWLSELAIWAPGLRRILIHTSAKQPICQSLSLSFLQKLNQWLIQSRSKRINEVTDLIELQQRRSHRFCGTGYTVVTTYENVRRSAPIWISHSWDYVILDEGQMIRNPEAYITLACKRFRTPHRLLLSGTPLQNDLRDLWSLVDFVFPGRLGTLPVFEIEFSDPIQRGGYANASPIQVQLAYRCSEVLRDMIHPFFLRRKKKDIPEVSRMPEKIEQIVFCKLSCHQRLLYESYIKSEEVINIYQNLTHYFRPITILRKLCNHPDLVCDPNIKSYDNFLQNRNDSSIINESYHRNEFSFIERSGKLQVLEKLLPLWKKQGHRVVIFTQWTKMLDILEQFMLHMNFKFLRMDGKTSIRSRQKVVDKFQIDLSYFGMILTTRTGGVGLNLTGANRVIIYDPDWNPQIDAQARERSWRFGQRNSVTIYRLITAGAIEEKIYHRQIFKTAVSNTILQGPKQRRLFSPMDLRNLFSLKSENCPTETSNFTDVSGITCIDSKKHMESMNDNSLKALLRSKGIAGVLDHDFLEKPYVDKSKVEREMDNVAKRFAEKAVKILVNSSLQTPNYFIPSTTRSVEMETQGYKDENSFLSLEDIHMEPNDSIQNSVSELDVSNNIPVSSATLLSKIQMRKDNMAETDKLQTHVVEENHDLPLKIRRYLMGFTQQGPTSQEIMEYFAKNFQDNEALFRRTLKSLAIVTNGTWQLKI